MVFDPGRRALRLGQAEVVDPGGLEDLEPRVATDRRDERVGHVAPRRIQGAQVVAGVGGLEQGVGNLVLPEYEEALDEALGEDAHAIAHVDARALAEAVRSVVGAELELDVDPGGVQALVELARDLLGGAAQHPGDLVPLAGPEPLQELDLRQLVARSQVLHRHGEGGVVPRGRHAVPSRCRCRASASSEASRPTRSTSVISIPYSSSICARKVAALSESR